MGGSLLLLFLLVTIGLGLVAYFRRPGTPKYLACAEYFVYLPGEDMPVQNEIMDRCLRGSPYGAPIGAKEGILFSDVRLHLGLILRSKNPHMFRPDTYETHIEPTAEILTALSQAKSVIKVRYLSEEVLTNKNHLQLLPYLAEAVAVLGSGQVIFDASADRLLTLESLQAQMVADRDMTRADVHLHVFSQAVEQGIVLETRGLVKIGLPELRTKPIESDMRILALQIVQDASAEVWVQGETPYDVEVQAFDDTFLVQFDTDARPTEVQIMRKALS